MNDMNEMKQIYIIGIAGTLMGGMAIMLQQKGYRISGSDQNLYPPMSDQLKDAGIKIFSGYDPAHITNDIDLVLVGNVVSKGHPEMEAVLAKKIPYKSVPEFLKEQYLPDHTPIVISGTHGKTTSTAMLTTILDAMELDPSFLIGGVHRNFNQNVRITKKGTPFVLEGDEYDTAYFDKVPKFKYYMPQVAMLTSVEFDHADIYKDIYQLRAVFYRLISMVPKEGALLHWDGILGMQSLARDAQCTMISYGFNPNSNIYCYSYRMKKGKMWFAMKFFGKNYEFTMPLFGKHNILNALGVIGIALSAFKATQEQIQKGLDNFLPPKRRQEVIYNQGGITLIDDFAHHPTAIKETIDAIKMRYPRRRIITLFEPRSNTSRQKIFHEQYIDAFAGSSWVFLTEPKPHRLIPEDQLLDIKKLKQDLHTAGIRAESYKDGAAIADRLAPRLQSGDVVLIMSNGDFDDVYTHLIDQLK